MWRGFLTSPTLCPVLLNTLESDINAILPEEPSQDYLRIAISQRGDPEIERLRQGESIDAPSLKVTPVLLANYGISLLCDTSYGRLRPIIPFDMRALTYSTCTILGQHRYQTH